VYRARYHDAQSGDRRGARAFVWAAAPDRLHVEIQSPVGGTAAVLDTGSGRVSITFPSDRVCYVGPADERALAALVGIAATPADVVSGLLGVGSSSLAIERTGPPGALPASARIRTSAGTLELRLKSIEPLVGDLDTVPPGMESRSLDDLPGDRAAGLPGHR
jgi:hypothetical protein